MLPEGADPPLRPTLPAWDRLFFDASHCLWARNAPIPGQRSETWDVLDPRGAHLGEVRLPAGFRLTDAKDSEVLGLTQDALGVEYLLGLRLEPAVDFACGSPFGG